MWLWLVALALAMEPAPMAMTELVAGPLPRELEHCTAQRLMDGPDLPQLYGLRCDDLRIAWMKTPLPGTVEAALDENQRRGLTDFPDLTWEDTTVAYRSGEASGRLGYERRRRRVKVVMSASGGPLYGEVWTCLGRARRATERRCRALLGAVAHEVEVPRAGLEDEIFPRVGTLTAVEVQRGGTGLRLSVYDTHGPLAHATLLATFESGRPALESCLEPPLPLLEAPLEVPFQIYADGRWSWADGLGLPVWSTCLDAMPGALTFPPADDTSVGTLRIVVTEG